MHKLIPALDFILRPWNSDSDYDGMSKALSASEQADNSNRRVTVEDLQNAFARMPASSLARDVILAEVEGRVVGYGRVARTDQMRCWQYELTAFLRPEWRRKGIGTAILRWQEQRARAIASENPTLKPEYLHINASQYKLGLHALACKQGYHVKESWVLMVRPDLENIPDIPLPEGLETRPVRPEDYGPVFFAMMEAYVPEGGAEPTYEIPEDYRSDSNFQPEMWQVAWETWTGKVVGSVCGYINHAENKQLGILRGYTEDISTVPAWQKRGVATALIYRSLRAQRAAGMTESALVCNAEKPDNYRLYQKCGFCEVKRDTVYEKKL